jgi:DNA-binding response OmpR family regulator
MALPPRPSAEQSRLKKILVVDDDADLRDTVCELSSLEGLAECLGMASLAEVQATRTLVLGCSLAIVDINLGESAPSGIDVYRWLQGAHFMGKIVFLTGYGADHPAVREAMSIAGTRTLIKPISVKELAALVIDAREAA